VDPDKKSYDVRENPTQAVAKALGFWGGPALSAETMRTLHGFSRRAGRLIRADWEQIPYRAMRQNALRVLIATSPDWQTC
jgi:hypothetical protein